MTSLREQVQGSLLLFSVILIAGCTAPLKEAIHRDPGYQASEITEISLLPAIDARLDTEIEVDVEGQILDAVRTALKKRGYEVSISHEVNSTTQLMEQFSEAELKTGDPQWIWQLPSDKRWVMILVLNDLTTQLTFGSTGNAELSGYMYDKEMGTMVWRDKGVAKVGQGGLIGMMFKGLMDEEAIRMAVANLVASIPERPK